MHDLPISDVLADIQHALLSNSRLVLQAPPGAGKTTARWDQVYRRPSAKSVDVTAALAGLFDPDEKTLQIMEELLGQDPVPLADLSADD